jgi:uncharacterized protein
MNERRGCLLSSRTVAEGSYPVVVLQRMDVVWMPQPTPRHGEVLGQLIVTHGVTGNLVPDAQLVALAIEHGLTIYSNDSDFARFPEVNWVDPLRG